VARSEVNISIGAPRSDETIFVDASSRGNAGDSLSCPVFAHLRPRTTLVLESMASLKRPCPMRSQYEWPFH